MTPLVSVLMPTFKHGPFIRRALESLQAQMLTAWELIVVDDGSPDNTRDILAPYLDDGRIHYHRLPRNQGLGAALNLATELATGRYLAYLPSDDVYSAEHLARLVALLDARPDVYLAYGGVQWGDNARAATLGGDEAVGREWEVLHADVQPGAALPNGNLLALVQAMHRRELENVVRWTPRSEYVSDTLEPDFWRALLAHNAQFAYSGAVSCQWITHPAQRHTVIAGKLGGLARYRNHYNIGRDAWLAWRPSFGPWVDERARYARFATVRPLPQPGGLKILLVGELGFNPERIMAFEERGHKLYGLWIDTPEPWDTVGPLPFGNVTDIPHDRDWPNRVREIAPDVIYALLNWQALTLIQEVIDARLDIPLVFHFKEGPNLCHKLGLWPTLQAILARSDGQILINAESLAWLQQATDGLLDPAHVLLLDGDLPKHDYLTDDWAPKLSAQDGEMHTVCPGRPLGLDPFAEIAQAGVHVHFYGRQFHQTAPNWTRDGLATGYMHLHPAVEPQDWVRELSRYDAAWFHVFRSHNHGDLRLASWDDLNSPARMSTYAAAGLPWIIRDNRPHRVAIQRVAQEYDVGVFFQDFRNLATQLRDRDRMAQLCGNMRDVRHLFAFDTHVDTVIAFLRQAMRRHQAKGSEE